MNNLYIYIHFLLFISIFFYMKPNKSRKRKSFFSDIKQNKKLFFHSFPSFILFSLVSYHFFPFPSNLKTPNYYSLLKHSIERGKQNTLLFFFQLQIWWTNWHPNLLSPLLSTVLFLVTSRESHPLPSHVRTGPISSLLKPNYILSPSTIYPLLTCQNRPRTCL